MARLVITFALILFCVPVAAQSFEGEVIYNNAYVSRTPGTTDKQYTALLGNTQNYYIKGGSYKYDANGTFLVWQLYVPRDKKLYSKIAHAPTILWDDVTVNPDKITSTEYHKGVTTVLGYLCDELILHYEANYQKYYFSSKLGIDSKLYADHKFNSWYAYLSKANAVPLKMSFRNNKYYLESIATQIKPMKLADGFFTLPGGLKTEKSPF